MKKIFYTSGLIALSAFVLFTSCKKKDKEDFPTKPNANTNTGDLVYVTPSFPSTLYDASGILVAARVTDKKVIIISPVKTTYEYGMAQFSNTPGNFVNLMDMGNIWLNDTNLTKGSTYNYLSTISNYSISLSSGVHWKVPNLNVDTTYTNVFPNNSDTITNWDDNWLPLTYTVYAKPAPVLSTDPAYPQYKIDSTQYVKDSVADYTINYSIPISSTTQNADSVSIIFFNNAGYYYERTWSDTVSYATFRPVDFKNYPSNPGSSNLIMQKNAIKYYKNTTASPGKNYYFLQMHSDIKYYTPTK